MGERGSCWSITINNPKVEDWNVTLPAKWALTGQMEQGKEGTPHYQGMLTTPQVRFSAVKKVFPRAHIELARNKAALQQYVKKDDTRLASMPDIVSKIPTLFDYQHEVAGNWDDIQFDKKRKWHEKEKTGKCLGDIALDYVDDIVAEDIKNGRIGVEYIAINPMWRSAWKKFWKQMVERERSFPVKIKSEDNLEQCSNELGSDTASVQFGDSDDEQMGQVD